MCCLSSATTSFREIDYGALSAYVSARLERNEEIERAVEAGVSLRDREGRPRRRLSPQTINMTLDLISRVLDDAVKRSLLASNPASDAELRLRPAHRKGNYLEADELMATIDAAGRIDDPVSPATLTRAELARKLRSEGHPWKTVASELGVAESTAIWLARRHGTESRASVRRAILATLGCAGLRNSEVCALDLRDLDFGHGVIDVRDAKTEAGVRKVNMTPWLRDVLLEYRLSRGDADATDPAFPTRTGARRNRRNINRRVVSPAVAAANALRVDRQEPPLPGSITAHTFRRTFITLMLEAGAPVPYVQAQVGHEDATTTLQIYAQVLKRRDRQRHGEAFDALMADAVPSPASIIIGARSHPRDAQRGPDLRSVSNGSGHGSDEIANL